MSNRAPPSRPYATFEEKGYFFAARGPAGEQEIQSFWVDVSRDEVILFTYNVRLFHRPIFGYDVDDIRELEETTDRIINLLPAATNWSDSDLARVRSDPAVIGQDKGDIS